MCGIAGIFNHNTSVDSRHVKTMCDILRHRGPDDEGFLAVNIAERTTLPLYGSQSQIKGELIDAFGGKANLFLGHRRLSIIDVTPAGHQPMCDKNGNVWIVFNGEIYNYVELKQDLIKKGYSFRTSTDTEVLLYSYIEWGMECLEKFNGMWAFVIYDKRKNVLWGSRDRFGVKPLYYYNKNGHFVFASEIKALVGLPFVEKKINEAVAFEYLVHNVNNPQQCFFEGIEELKPSEAFSVDLGNGDVKKWKYYHLVSNEQWAAYDEKSFSQINEKVRELVFNAVRLRLRSDVPVGSCLSGGMDSSAIVCIVNDYLKKESITSIGVRQKVFTACYAGESIDESKWAKIVVEATKTEWQRTFPETGAFLQDMDDLVYSQDVPFGSTSIYAQYRVMKLAHENGVKVLLDGQGGDELFTGYADYYSNFFIDLLKHGALRTLRNEFMHRQNSPVSALFFRMLLYSFGKRPAYDMLPPVLKYYYYLFVNPFTRYLGRDFVNRNKRNKPTLRNTALFSLNGMLEYTMTCNLSELLRYEDRNSMHFSIESRTPFADDIDLITYVFSLPGVYKIHNGWSKYLLRQSMAGLVPDEITVRTDKIGFSTPEYLWIADCKDELLSGMKSDGLDYFVDYGKFSNNWDQLVHGRKGAMGTTIWRYVNFALWKKRFGM
jgi:asparagine synthase (glutamine-hydrolysing)